MNLTLLIVVILTAIALVGIALGVARIVSPRSYNRQKGEAYECGIPTRGRSWMRYFYFPGPSPYRTQVSTD